MSLAGKVAIVTGAALGIGAAIALKLARNGAKVAVAYATSSSAPKAEALFSQFTDLDTTGVPIQADLTDKDAPSHIVQKTLETFGGSKIGILVNNAGVADSHPMEEISAKTGGRIIHISSTSARTALVGTAVYSASKATVEAFTRVMAAELGPKYGVTVTAVNPGSVATDMYLSAPDALRNVLHEMVKNVPAGARMGTPEDIADIVGFLASEDTRWISGNVVTANGGMVMM